MIGRKRNSSPVVRAHALIPSMTMLGPTSGTVMTMVSSTSIVRLRMRSVPPMNWQMVWMQFEVVMADLVATCTKICKMPRHSVTAASSRMFRPLERVSRQDTDTELERDTNNSR